EMGALRVGLVLVLCLCTGSRGVQVKVGDRSFPLEAVKQLKELMGLDDGVSPHLAETSVAAVCTDPLLPQVFQPVCQEKGAGIVLSRLAKFKEKSKTGCDHTIMWLCCLIFSAINQ
uniref:Guanylate cyclase activator 2B n=1 Tax=Salarias fasciatus TaxID=181472 RepID=A0A672J1U5_SALFA